MISSSLQKLTMECGQNIPTVYFEGVYCLELSRSHFTQDGEHVHKFIEAEIPHPIL